MNDDDDILFCIYIWCGGVSSPLFHPLFFKVMYVDDNTNEQHLLFLNPN